MNRFFDPISQNNGEQKYLARPLITYVLLIPTSNHTHIEQTIDLYSATTCAAQSLTGREGHPFNKLDISVTHSLHTDILPSLFLLEVMVRMLHTVILVERVFLLTLINVILTEVIIWEKKRAAAY